MNLITEHSAALKSFQNRDYKTAIELYKKLINHDSSLSNLFFFNIAVCLSELNNCTIDDAVHKAKKLIAFYPKKSNNVRVREKMIYQSSISHDEMLGKIRTYNKQKSSRKAKVVVYTAIMGNYDVPILPETIVNDWDYVLFTDGKLSGEHIFECRDFDYFNDDITKIARHVKINPHKYFSEYEYSVWIDSNILVKGDHLIKTMNDAISNNKLMIINPHPSRDNLVDELHKCCELGKDVHEIMESQVRTYLNDGFPDNLGLLETNIFIRKHNSDKVINFSNIWWQEVQTKSNRDQLSVMYAIWKTGVSFETLRDAVDFRYNDIKNGYLIFPHYAKERPTMPIYGLLPFLDFIPSYHDTYNSVAVVVPVYNALEDVEKCLFSLNSNMGNFKVTVYVVNDGSNFETTEFLNKFCVENKRFILINHSENIGYTRAVNSGLKLTKEPYVITLNSDTIVTKGWLSKMIDCAISSPLIGIVGPLSNAASWQNIPYLYDENNKFAINELPKNTTADMISNIVSQCSKKVFPRIQFVNGFCFLIKRKVIDKIGYMDEVNFPVGYGEENDFCIRASDAGFELAIADNAYVYHAKSKSFGSERKKELSKHGRSMLIKKYGESVLTNKINLMKEDYLLNEIRSNILNHIKL